VLTERVLNVPELSSVDSEPNTVPCGFDCGYLADSETDLDVHEAECDNTACPEAGTDVPAPRSAGSVRRGGGTR
jgi:hypothetical protein